jgi:hypothetical protein
MGLRLDFIMIGCAKSSKPTRDLLKSNHRINPSGSACAVYPRINRFVMDLTSKPGTKRAAKCTSTTIKVTGVKWSKPDSFIWWRHTLGTLKKESIAQRSQRG